MRNSIQSMLLLAGLLFLNACGGDDSDPAPQQNDNAGEFSNCRVVQTDRLNFADHYYEYDDQGRPTIHTYSDYEYEFTYSAGKVVVKNYYEGELQRTETITLNSAGRATHIEAEYTNGITPKKFTEFQYDGNMQLVKTTVTEEGKTTENHTVYQWQDGNMVAESDPDLSDMTTYTYSSDELAQPADWFRMFEIDRGYVTLRNKNRVTSITTPSGTVYTHSYNEEDNGLIKSVTISPSNGDPYTKNFTYECD